MFSMPNGAKPAGILGSTKPPSVVTDLKGRPTPEESWSGANTSIVPARKLVAKRKTPLTLVPTTRPLYTAPLAASGTLELSAASTASLRGIRPPAHAEIVPSSVAQMNAAGRFVPGTRNAVIGFVVGFHTMPVGAAGVGFGGGAGGGLTCIQAVLGIL